MTPCCEDREVKTFFQEEKEREMMVVILIAMSVVSNIIYAEAVFEMRERKGRN